MKGMQAILNGNNNFLPYEYNVMEEYDYYCRLWKLDEVKRCWESYDHYGEQQVTPIEDYPRITEMIEDRMMKQANLERYGDWTFSKFKATRMRGDWKLQKWWDGFRKELYEINGAKDIQGYMINISPLWPEKYSLDKYAIHLERAINKFAHQGLWGEFHYVIETGKNGDHLHAHMVCIPTDPAKHKAKAYMKKGNHNNWFRREFDNKANKYPVGFVGCVKGRNAIQTVSIGNQEIYKDKLDYLQEETKPEDHQNKRKLMDRRRVVFS